MMKYELRKAVAQNIINDIKRIRLIEKPKKNAPSFSLGIKINQKIKNTDSSENNKFKLLKNLILFSI